MIFHLNPLHWLFFPETLIILILTVMVLQFLIQLHVTK